MSDAIERAWAALDLGDAEAAIEHTEGAGEEHDALVIRVTAWLALDDLELADSTLARLRELDDGGDPESPLWLEGELRLRQWRVDDARAAFERLLEIDPSAQACERLALCADLAGDPAAADRWMEEAHRLDPDTPVPPKLSEVEFGEVVDEAIGRLPEPFQDALEEIPVLVDAVPSAELASGDPVETPPDLLGLFLGPSRLDGAGDGPELPPSIHLFQRNLERVALDREELVGEIRVTLYHELGHALGFDEDGVDGMGLE